MTKQELLSLAEQALREIVDAWITNNAEGDDYAEGYDDGLQRSHDIAAECLRALALQKDQTDA